MCVVHGDEGVDTLLLLLLVRFALFDIDSDKRMLLFYIHWI